MARDNGFADRIVFIEAPIAHATLDERAHVLMGDLCGVLPPFELNLRDIEYARSQLLVEQGVVMPRRYVISAALVHAPRAFEERRRVWTSDPCGVRIASALRFVDNSWCKHHATPDDLRTDAENLLTIDYAQNNGRAAGQVSWTIEAACQVHGLLVWFEAELADGATLSNHPTAGRTSHGQAFFPWPHALDLDKHDMVTAEVRVDPIGSELIWTWNTDVIPASSTKRWSYRQSDFSARPLSVSASKRHAISTGAGPLSPAGQATLRALIRMNEDVQVTELARELCVEFPEQFRNVAHSLDFVAELRRSYGC
jgi:protein arginine N-methyltransferase 1